MVSTLHLKTASLQVTVRLYDEMFKDDNNDIDCNNNDNNKSKFSAMHF